MEKTKAEAERADIDLRVVTKQVAVLSKEVTCLVIQIVTDVARW